MGKALLPHNKRNCYPPYPDHYLKSYYIFVIFQLITFKLGIFFLLVSKFEGVLSSRVYRFSLTGPSQQLKRPWKILLVRASHVLNDHIEMAVFSPVVDARQCAL